MQLCPYRMFVRLVSTPSPAKLRSKLMKSLGLLIACGTLMLGFCPGTIEAQSNALAAVLQPRVTGTVEHLAGPESKFVDQRAVDVWLPPSYLSPRSPARRYPVLYVHDGQNVFDPATSFIGVDWGIDETMTRLIAEKKIPEVIVVAIWNTPKRLAEYMPQRALERVPASELDAMFKSVRQKPLGDAYLHYLVTELKPAIDARYRTLADRAHTSIMGSSLGGLISLYAICEFPEVFGAAACLSTSWTVAGGATTRDLALPDPQTHRLYFDYGAETKNDRYEPLQRAVDAQMKSAGYTPGTNWITKAFPGEEHSERAWRKRVNEPLEFLLR